MVIIFVALYILTALIVASSIAGIVYGIGALVCKNKVSVVNNLKWIGLCGIIVAIFFAMIYFSIPAHAEELPDGFYYKVAFIDETEDTELNRFDLEDHAIAKFLIHTDDLNHIWDYWDIVEENEEEFINWAFDKDLSNFALYWARENNLDVELDKEDRITRGRIVVLTMWECTDNPYDDEVMDVYYTEFITW